MEKTEPTWIVLKFGSSRLASPERWTRIAELVRQRRQEGDRPLVVCPALSGVTDALEQLLRSAPDGTHEPVLSEIRERHDEVSQALVLANETTWQPLFEELTRLALGLSLTRDASPALRARVLAMGERMASRIGAALLSAQGLQVHAFDAREVLRAVRAAVQPASQRALSADCAFGPDPDLQERLVGEHADVYLTQGAIARTPAGETVRIGRGGSDTSAAYFASKLQARRLEIWTDVPGLFTADPQEIPLAHLLRHLDYAEAQELTTMGTKTLHPRCIRPVREQRIPLHLRMTAAPEMEGTIISDQVPDAGAQVKAIVEKTGVMLIEMTTLGMWQQAGFLADVFSVFEGHDLSVDLVATSEADVTVSLDEQHQTLDPNVLDGLLEDLRMRCDVRTIGPCATVSLVGRGIRAILHRLGPALEAFEEQHVHLVSQAANDLNFSFVVDEDQAPRLVRMLHRQLFGTHLPAETFGPSFSDLFEKTADRPREQVWWRTRRDELLAMAEETSPIYVYDEATLQTQAAELQSLATVDRLFYAVKANAHAGVLHSLHEAGLGFECVSPGEVNHVRETLSGLDPDRILFTPNFASRDEYAFGCEQKVHLTLDNLYPLEAWPEVFEGQNLFLRVDPGRGRGHHRHVRTAGAHSKFGIASSELGRARELVRRAGARVTGLHAHLGSGIVAPDTWARTATLLAARAEDYFPDTRVLNVGGGLGVAEHPGARTLDVAAMAHHLATFKKAHPPFELWMEPGRFLVAHAGVMLARVTQLKQKDDTTYFVGLETGMNTFVRPALYGSHHEIRNLTRLDAPDALTAEVVGPICESGDVLGHSRRLPQTQEGDCLLIATTGAYGRVMSSHYNLRPPAAERLLHAEPVPQQS